MKKIGLWCIIFAVRAHAMEPLNAPSWLPKPLETEYQAGCSWCKEVLIDENASIATKLFNHCNQKHGTYTTLQQRRKMIVRPRAEVHYIAICQYPGCEKKIKTKGYPETIKKNAQKHTKKEHRGSDMAFKFITITLRGFLEPTA